MLRRLVPPASGLLSCDKPQLTQLYKQAMMIASEGDAQCVPDWATAGIILGVTFAVVLLGLLGIYAFVSWRQDIKAKLVGKP